MEAAHGARLRRHRGGPAATAERLAPAPGAAGPGRPGLHRGPSPPPTAPVSAGPAAPVAEPTAPSGSRAGLQPGDGNGGRGELVRHRGLRGRRQLERQHRQRLLRRPAVHRADLARLRRRLVRPSANLATRPTRSAWSSRSSLARASAPGQYAGQRLTPPGGHLPAPGSRQHRQAGDAEPLSPNLCDDSHQCAPTTTAQIGGYLRGGMWRSSPLARPRGKSKQRLKRLQAGSPSGGAVAECCSQRDYGNHQHEHQQGDPRCGRERRRCGIPADYERDQRDADPP